MKQQTFTVSENTVIVLRAHAEARLTGWDRQEVSVDTGDEQARIEQGSDYVRIVCLDDCEVFVPARNKIQVEKISGDARMANLTGGLEVEKVGGNLSAQQIGEHRIRRVGGNCRVQGAASRVWIERVGGSFDGLDLRAGLTLESVGGDISAAGVRGGALARAGGSIQIALEEVSDREIQLRAGSDIRLQLPANASGTFDLSCGSEDIRIELGERAERFHQRGYHFSLGQGGAMYALRAGSNIRISDKPISGEPGPSTDFMGWEERLNRKIRQRMQDMERSHEWTERADRRAADALRRAQERVQAAMERIETSMPDSAGVYSSVGFVPQPPTPPAPPAPPAPAADAPVQPMDPVSQPQAAPASSEGASGVSDEERLLILRMLQEKKISVEQAEELMEALEGQSETGEPENE